MNEFLAEMYGTRESIGAPSSDNSDVEKLAEAQLLDEALQAEGIDIDQLPGETILKLAYQILGEDSHLVKAAMEESQETPEHETAESDEEEEEESEEEKEAALKMAAMRELQGQGNESFEEKVAQADFLGRVMAHSYVNEMAGMDKEAISLGQAGQAVKNWGQLAGYGAKRGAGAVAGAARKAGGKAKELGGKAKETGEKAYKATKEHVGKHGKKYSAGAGVAGGAAGGYALGKNASALDMLAEKRAMQWAEEHGLLQSNNAEEEKLASAVDQRAYQMLVNQGIDVDAIEAAARR